MSALSTIPNGKKGKKKAKLNCRKERYAVLCKQVHRQFRGLRRFFSPLISSLIAMVDNRFYADNTLCIDLFDNIALRHHVKNQ